MNLKALSGFAFGFLFLLSGCGGIKNLQKIDEDPATGFAIYRSGQPKAEDVATLCAMGVTKVFALNQGAGEYESALKAACPNAQVVYNQMQDPDAPISEDFLNQFDQAVTAAKASGDKILFHCNCGCHRTGRLAAYYRMKFQGWTSAVAIEEMIAVGKDMDQHPTLPIQVRALEEYIHGRSCTEQPSSFCMNASATGAPPPPTPQNN